MIFASEILNHGQSHNKYRNVCKGPNRFPEVDINSPKWERQVFGFIDRKKQIGI